MRRKGLLVLAAAALVAGALTLALTANAAKTVAAGLGKQPECYPNNSFEQDPGDTHGAINKVKAPAQLEIEPAKGPSGTTSGDVRVDASLQVFDGGPFRGSATVIVSIGGNANVKFESRCIAEASTDNDSGDIPDLEAEYEGTVTGLPWDKKRQPAVFSVVGHLDDNGEMLVQGSIEQGSTCFENKGELNFVTNTGKATGKISADDIHAGRWGFPDGFDDTNCPDASA